MNKKYMSIAVTLVFLMIVLCGCFKENSSENENKKNISLPLNSLSLTLSDLPTGFSIINKKYDPEAQNDLETYQALFRYQDENEECSISLFMWKHGTIKTAQHNFDGQKDIWVDSYYEKNSVKSLDITPIQKSKEFGDQSSWTFGDFSADDSGRFPMFRTVIIFRISNVVVLINKNDYDLIGRDDFKTSIHSFSKEIAEIIENRITQNLEVKKVEDK